MLHEILPLKSKQTNDKNTNGLSFLSLLQMFETINLRGAMPIFAQPQSLSAIIGLVSCHESVYGKEHVVEENTHCTMTGSKTETRSSLVSIPLSDT